MPEITQELYDALRKMAATAIVEDVDDDALVAVSVEIRLLRAALRAIDADPAFAPPMPTWQERVAAEVVRLRRFHGPPQDHPDPARSLRQIVLDVLAEHAPPAPDPEAHAALLRLVRATGEYRKRLGTWAALDDAYLALPASVLKEAGL